MMGFFSSPPDEVDDRLPDKDVLDAALALPVQDRSGKEHVLRSLVQGFARTILVFVRHNHCGACHAYVSSMQSNEILRATASDQERNKPKESRTQVIVIGHGSYEGIDRYNDLSDNPFDMYVDSSKRIHKLMGLTRRNLANPDKEPEYFGDMTNGRMVWDSVKNMATSGSLLWKGGDFALLGGDFVLDQDLRCIYCHRMQTTTDHTPVKKLAEYVGEAGD